MCWTYRDLLNVLPLSTCQNRRVPYILNIRLKRNSIDLDRITFHIGKLSRSIVQCSVFYDVTKQ
jgi:hypothetical protein